MATGLKRRKEGIQPANGLQKFLLLRQSLVSSKEGAAELGAPSAGPKPCSPPGPGNRPGLAAGDQEVWGLFLQLSGDRPSSGNCFQFFFF